MKVRILFFFSLLLSANASAQSLRDPTRPLTGSSGKATVTAVTPAPPPPMPQLQMVLIGAQRSKAVIDGELLEVGDLVNGMRIEAIRPDAVVLKTRRGLRTLPLLVQEEK